MNKTPLLNHLWFILLCTALSLSPWLGGQWSGVGPAAARALVAAAGLIWLYVHWNGWRVPNIALWLWGFAGWGAVSALQQTSLHASLSALSDVVTLATLAALTAYAGREPVRRAVLLGAVMLSLAVVSGLGIQHAFASEPGWREFGPFATPNIFASWLITLLPCAILLAVRSWKRDSDDELDRRSLLNVAVTMIAIIAMALGFLVLLMTGSKGAVAALLLAIVIIFPATRAWRNMRGVMAGAGLLVLICCVGIGGRTLLGRVESAGGAEAHSSQFRVLTWKGAAQMAAAHPVMGTGIGTFGAGYYRYAIAGWTQAAHNAYLHTAAETGLPGLLLFMGALGSAALMLWRRAHGGSLVAAGALAGFVAAAVHNGVDYGWSLWAPSAVMWSLAGLSAQEDDLKPLAAWKAWLMTAVLALTLLGNVLMANAASLAEKALDRTSDMAPYARAAALRSARTLDTLDGTLAREQGVALARAGDHTAAITALEEATRLSPNDPVAWRMLGEGYKGAQRIEDARRAFARGLQVSPNAYRLMRDAAELEAESGSAAEALNFYRRIVRVAEGPVGLHPATPEIVDIEPMLAYEALAAAADKRGDSAEAARYRRALIVQADRYLANREKYPMLWEATGKDNPREFSQVQGMRTAALAALQR